MYRLRTIFALTIVYLALTANLELLNVLAGLVLSALVTLLLPQRPPGRMNWRRLPAAAWALLRYILILAVDLLQSGIQVAGIVLSREIDIQPGIVAIPAQTKTDIGTALSAHAITLTPGELVVEIGNEGTMYTHVLDATTADTYVREAQERRAVMLDKIFD